MPTHVFIYVLGMFLYHHANSAREVSLQNRALLCLVTEKSRDIYWSFLVDRQELELTIQPASRRVFCLR